MDNMNIGAIVIVIIIAFAVVFLLVKKNQKDRAELNPDAEAAVEEVKNEQDKEHL